MTGTSEARSAESAPVTGIVESVQAPQGDGPAAPALAASSSSDARFVRTAGQVMIVAVAVLAATIAAAFLRTPQEPLVLIQMLSALVLVIAYVARQQIVRQLADRRAARDAGITRLLQGLSRSLSSDAIVQAMIDELRRAADADHIVVARLRPVDRVVEATLVSSRAKLPPSRSILPASVLEPASQPEARRGRVPSFRGRRSVQVIADDVGRRLGETYGLSNTLSAALVSHGRVIGALILSRRQPREWSTADRRLLTWSASELSAALARAFMFEEAENRANVDALTGLPNRRYLEELLSTVGPRRRSGDRIGALMIDLDHFKRLNDRHGHVTDDRVLRAVGESIATAVRSDDTPSRYGGEEFAVVLQRATHRQAVEVAERIRQQIRALSPRELGVDAPISVSIGVAVADAGDTDVQALLVAADDALYRAKRQGRDRVVLAG